MKIGILQSAGIAGTIIEQALNHPEQQEVFTPVIYSKENGNDKNVSSDLKFGNINAVVVAPGSATEFNFPGNIPVYVDGERRVAAVSEYSLLDDSVTKLKSSLRRDFQCSCPRIAVIYRGAPLPAFPQDEALPEAASALTMNPYSVYEYDAYVEQQMYQHFDLTIVIGDTLLADFVNTTMQPTHTRFLAGLPMVMAMTDYTADSISGDAADLTEPVLALRRAVYLVMDVVTCRSSYDVANNNPLPKLYHERRDDSEKVRFAVKKPF